MRQLFRRGGRPVSRHVTAESADSKNDTVLSGLGGRTAPRSGWRSGKSLMPYAETDRNARHLGHERKMLSFDTW